MSRYSVQCPGFYFKDRGTSIVIPPYWITMPMISITDTVYGTYTVFVTGSKQEIEQLLQDVLIVGWKDRVKWFIRYWARWYYRQFPDLYKDGTLIGFNPGDLVLYFWPGETSERKDYLRKELTLWAEKARTMLTMLATPDSQPIAAPPEGTMPTSDS